MIETFERKLPHGITLSCRAAGERGRPLMLFLHGFPEAAFVWDELLEHFSQPEHGAYRCVAPNLRGFEKSSAPGEVEAYKAPLMIEDIATLAASEDAQGRITTLVAHDWGGAFAWGFANALAQRLDRLVIINSPHPATFARELRGSPAQQRASAYMNWLARPGSEALLAADDYRGMWKFLDSRAPGPGGQDWLTEAVKEQYRAVWGAGLTGGCNLYRVTPLRPPLPGQPSTSIPIPSLPPPERLRVEAPTLVLWALDDIALLPGLLEGLEQYVPRLEVKKVPGATHWIVHEQPALVASEIEAFIARHPSRRNRASHASAAQSAQPGCA